MKKTRPQWIPVVTALLRQSGKVLVGQRPETKSLPGIWEFPGGKIELGETPEKALFRELQEELGIEAEIGPLKLVTSHSYGDVGIILLFYEVPFWRGEPRAKHHMALKWVTPKELEALALPEANQIILPRIKEVLT